MPNLLRNPNVNYTWGWFFITLQVAHNKSVFGAIVDEKCELNALGQAIHAAWQSQPEHAKDLYLDAFVVMPNHMHAILKLNPPSEETSAQEETNNLSLIVGRFKSYTTCLYHQLKAEGQCVDIGPSLWQRSFYDRVITEHDAFLKVREYIANNPKHWNHDRFGPVTTHSVGNLELLNQPLVAFVASETPPNAEPCKPCRYPSLVASAHCGGGDKSRPVISTFTSPEERTMRATCLRLKRAFIWVCPGGLPEKLSPAITTACDEGRALICSPMPIGTGLNKQRAIWCNQYVIRQASEVWHGTIRKGGSLETLLKSIKGK